MPAAQLGLMSHHLVTGLVSRHGAVLATKVATKCLEYVQLCKHDRVLFVLFNCTHVTNGHWQFAPMVNDQTF